MEHSEQASVKRLRRLSVSSQGCDVLWEENCGWRMRHEERAVHGCFPGCCSLGPQTGAFTLFSNTAHWQPDKTKTLIYTSLHPTISLCFSVFCYPLISTIFLSHYLCMCTSIWLCFTACVHVFFIFLCAQGCRLIETADQDLTDFTKCLAIMLEEIKRRQLQVNTVCIARCESLLANVNVWSIPLRWQPVKIKPEPGNG